MIYIPTLTSKLRYCDVDEDYILYSPNEHLTKVIKGGKITIWDNYTFYLRTHLKNNKQERSKQHYLWLIDFIQNNYQEGITLITPDVDWLEDSLEIEELWKDKCGHYPQLYVPNTWQTSTDMLNIVGYAIRKNMTQTHPKWTHCLGHTRNDVETELLTYDACIPRQVLIK